MNTHKQTQTPHSNLNRRNPVSALLSTFHFDAAIAPVFNPFDSNHWIYRTGSSIFEGHNLMNWDASPRRNMALGPLGRGGVKLVTAVGDVGGFVHMDMALDASPTWRGVSG
jgi:hypothetical protein